MIVGVIILKSGILSIAKIAMNGKNLLVDARKMIRRDVGLDVGKDPRGRMHWNKCIWCDKRTDNPVHDALDANKNAITVFYCDKCREADKDFRKIFKLLNAQDATKRLMRNLAQK